MNSDIETAAALLRSQHVVLGKLSPDELCQYLGRALRILYAYAGEGVSIDGEEEPERFVSEVAKATGQDDWEPLFEDYPRNWENVIGP